MICPTCGHDNLPGSETCDNCRHDLTQLDRPTAANRVERSLMEDPISTLRPGQPVTVTPATSLAEAMRIMLEANLGALLIVDDAGRLQGIFSERDLLAKVAGQIADFARAPIRDFMTPNPETARPTDPLALALHKMDVGGYRHLPLVDGGRPVGVISVRDLLRHITRLCKER
jgi:CBS domain-containing protein